ncbi:hypothetical protein [Paucidesulfovibrio longus]|uniref:hypothetical protein n=1 Tax=Paucidesulfovibrio longus TaxID=889 RepID=UPI0003B60DF8|nr:hypothetical protein [Paucidesulfovibrio longus]
MTIPTWALDACLDDETFAAAYEAVSAERRALLKTAIARQYAWRAPAPCSETRCARVWTQGFESLELAAPADVCLLLFDASCASPARILAALLPALNAGIGTVLAVHARGPQDAPSSEAVLAAFELAGQEAVLELPRGKVRELIEASTENGESCIVLAFGGTSGLVPDGFADGFSRRLWTAPAQAGIAVFLEGEGADADLEALAFAHPDGRFQVAGADSPLPDDRFAHLGPEFDHIVRAGGQACFASGSSAEDALAAFPLVFGPGHEACWLFPDLHSEFFQVRRTAWRSEEQCETEEE